MSLEAAISENTKALHTLIEIIKTDGAQRAEVAAKIDGMVNKAPATAAAKPKKAEPVAEKAAEPVTETRAITETPEDRKEPEEGPSAAVVAAQEGIAAFISVAVSETDRAERRNAATALIDTLGSRRTPPAPAGSLKSKDLTDAEATRFVDVGLPNLLKKFPAPVAEPAEADDI